MIQRRLAYGLAIGSGCDSEDVIAGEENARSGETGD
jgi:hypothetical protein